MRHIRQIRSIVESRDKKLHMAASGLAVDTVWTLNDAAGSTPGKRSASLRWHSHDCLRTPTRNHAHSASSLAFNIIAAMEAWPSKYSQQAVNLRDIPTLQQAWLKLRHG